MAAATRPPPAAPDPGARLPPRTSTRRPDPRPGRHRPRVGFQHLSRKLGIGHGETTPDGRFTLRRVECLAACGGGPCLQVNEQKFHEHLDEAAVDRLLETLK